MRSSAIIAWDVLEACSIMSSKIKSSPTNNKPNVTQAINTKEQNTHDRGPQLWPSTDLEIYAREYFYGTNFRRTSGNILRANPTVATGLNYQSSLAEAPEHTHDLGSRERGLFADIPILKVSIGLLSMGFAFFSK
jgi:hypothetical protein